MCIHTKNRATLYPLHNIYSLFFPLFVRSFVVSLLFLFIFFAFYLFQRVSVFISKTTSYFPISVRSFFQVNIWVVCFICTKHQHWNQRAMRFIHIEYANGQRLHEKAGQKGTNSCIYRRLWLKIEIFGFGTLAFFSLSLHSFVLFIHKTFWR